MPQIIEPRDREHWLQLKSQDVSSTEVASLYGEGYQTEFELYHTKKSGSIIELEDNDRMKWGRRLQDVIAAGIAEDEGWQIKPLTCYARHDTQRGMGASFDYEVIFSDGVKGIMEIKAVDFIIHRDDWIDDADYKEAPVHIEMQLQQQLEILKYERGVIAALVSGNKPVIIMRERDHEMGKELCERIEKFWQDVDSGNEPPVDYNRDGEMLKKLFANAVPRTEVLTDNPRAVQLCDEYNIASTIESTGKKRKEAAKNELMTLITDAEKAICGPYKISAAVINRAEYLSPATSYRNMRITRKK